VSVIKVLAYLPRRERGLVSWFVGLLIISIRYLSLMSRRSDNDSVSLTNRLHMYILSNYAENLGVPDL